MIYRWNLFWPDRIHEFVKFLEEQKYHVLSLQDQIYPSHHPTRILCTVHIAYNKQTENKVPFCSCKSGHACRIKCSHTCPRCIPTNVGVLCCVGSGSNETAPLDGAATGIVQHKSVNNDWFLASLKAKFARIDLLACATSVYMSLVATNSSTTATGIFIIIL